MRQIFSDRFPHHKLILLCARTIMPAEMREEVHVILQRGVNWTSLKEDAHRAGIAPLLWCNLKDFSANIPEKTMRQLRAIYYNNMGRNLFFSDQLKDLCRLLSENHIPVVPLKGVLLAETVFGNIAARQIGDMDILIRPKDIHRAYDLLTVNGFSCGTNGLDLDAHMAERRDLLLDKTETQIPYTLDVHWRFKDSFLKLPEEALWNHLTAYPWQGTTIHILSKEWTLLHLIHHLHCHGYPLKILVDVAETLRAYRETMDWDKVSEFAYQCSMTRSLVTALQSIEAVLNYPFPKEVVPLMNSLKSRRWLCSIVGTEKWFFSRFAKMIQVHGYLCTAFSALFTDGSYLDLFKAYWKRSKLWIRRLPGKEKKPVHT